MRKLMSLKRIVTLTSVCLFSIIVVRNLFHLAEVELKPCKMEHLDPWDKALKPFLHTPPPLTCSNRTQLMYVDEDGLLVFNSTALKMYDLHKTPLRCSTRAMNRELGDLNVVFEKEIDVKPPSFVKSHVFRVVCWNDSQNVVYDYLHFNPLWNQQAMPCEEADEESQERLSVMVFGIDSVSRSHALRNLPLSYRVLSEEFEAYDFEGYSKVGENTWPNLMPLLTGRSHRHFPLVQHLNVHADSMPLLWNEAAMRRIATFFAEDRPEISTFNYGKSGFMYQPTDYYFRPYTLGMHQFEPKIVESLGKPSWDCYGVDSYFDIQIEYLKGFLSQYRRKRKFAFFWNNQAGHEAFASLSRADDSLVKFLRWLKETDHKENTVLLVLSDHGYRIGGASLTHVGRAENNKPWLMVHIPRKTKQKYPWLHDVISQNTKRLVTHYDVYQTILDILNNEAFYQHVVSAVKSGLVRRNIFSPVPKLRSCPDAGIEEKYCTCKEKLNISTSRPLVQYLAHFLVKGINDILAKQRSSCQTLYLHNVTESLVSYSNHDDENMPLELQKLVQERERQSFWSRLFSKPVNEHDETGRYYILFHTKPGYAHFEGTVDFARYKSKHSDDHMTMVGEPSRLDRYGNQSNCMTDSFLRLYCYCKNYIAET